MRSFRVTIREADSPERKPGLEVQVTDVTCSGVVCMLEAGPGEWMLSLRGVGTEQAGRAIAAALDQLYNIDPDIVDVAIANLGRSRPGRVINYSAPQ